MKIVQINETCGTGSIGRLSLDLSMYLKDKGNDVLFVYTNDKSNYYNSYRTGSSIENKFHAVFSRITGLQGYFSYFSTKRLIRKLKKMAPDIIHIHNLHSNYINLKVLFDYCTKYKIKTVATLHDSWLFTGKCTYYVPAKCQKWKSTCGSCPLLHKDNVNPTFFFDRTHKCLLDKKDMIEKIPNFIGVGVSNWVTNDAKESLVLHSKKIITIYNWVDESIFKYRENNKRELLGIEKKKCVLMVSSILSIHKGYREMCYLAEKLSDEYVIIYIGNNKHNYAIPQNVIHIEHTSNACELAEYYSMADVCVNTTLYETFGMVTVESLFCGTPVIIYGNTGSKELVNDDCGIVVDQTKGYEEIKKTVEKICSREILFDRSKIRKIMHERFNREKLLGEYLALYESK